MKTYLKILLSLILIGLVGASCYQPKIHLAADIKTREYLGVVITETRDFESKEVLFYETGTASSELSENLTKLKFTNHKPND